MLVIDPEPSIATDAGRAGPARRRTATRFPAAELSLTTVVARLRKDGARPRAPGCRGSGHYRRLALPSDITSDGVMLRCAPRPACGRRRWCFRSGRGPLKILAGTMSSKRAAQPASLHQANEREHLKPKRSGGGPIPHKLYPHRYENRRDDCQKPATSSSYVSLLLHVALGSQMSAP